MKVAFLLNQIDNRGTGNAVYDYAHYNEEILGNKSLIYCADMSPPNKEMEEKLLQRFGSIYHQFIHIPADVLYHIKSGENNGISTATLRYAVHAVFNASDPHGDRYAAISQWLGEKNGVPWVPHIVSLPSHNDSYRDSFEIPSTATVFGRHGGSNTFDIPFAWSAINRALSKRKDIWFLFLNTTRPTISFYDENRVKFLDATVDPYKKRTFINSCNVMLHARHRGETFGISVGEFAICDKPVLTYGNSEEKAHLQELVAYYAYYNEEELLAGLLLDWRSEDNDLFSYSRYKNYTPENVMKKFKEVFLD